MEFVKVRHHSVSDWDFNTTEYTLDTATYISPPSSLRFNVAEYMALLKQSSVGMPLPEGMIKTYFRFRYGASSYPMFIFFRNQAPDGSANYNNTYFIRLKASTSGAGQPYDKMCFWYAVGGLPFSIEEKPISPTLSPDTWHLVRIKFWVYSGVLMVQPQIYMGEWVDLCGAFSHPANRWATSDINRVGIGSLLPATTPRHTWFDDTEVYRRV